jgi:hypothetical protein
MAKKPFCQSKPKANYAAKLRGRLQSANVIFSNVSLLLAVSRSSQAKFKLRESSLTATEL